MQDIARKTLETIRNERIVPDSRWKHRLRVHGIWAGAFLAVLLGALTFAVASAIASDLDWDLYRFLGLTPLAYGFFLFPFRWLAVFILLLTAAVYGVTSTTYGYRYRRTLLVSFALFTAVLLGSILWITGAGQRLNHSISKTFPAYGSHIVTKEAQWSQPDRGLLAGTVTNTKETAIMLKDLTGNDWVIRISPDTTVRLRANTEPGSMIKIIGRRIDTDTFSAEEIRPWEGMGHRQRAGRRP